MRNLKIFKFLKSFFKGVSSNYKEYNKGDQIRATVTTITFTGGKSRVRRTFRERHNSPLLSPPINSGIRLTQGDACFLACVRAFVMIILSIKKKLSRKRYGSFNGKEVSVQMSLVIDPNDPRARRTDARVSI